MVYYFFDSKEGLFTASALTGPEHPLQQLGTLLDEEHRGDRHRGWCAGSSSTGTKVPHYEPLLTLWRSAAIQPRARKVLHDSLAGPTAKRVAAEFGVADAELRVELVASHLAGLAFARYQLKIEPIASTRSRTWSRGSGRPCSVI